MSDPRAVQLYGITLREAGSGTPRISEHDLYRLSHEHGLGARRIAEITGSNKWCVYAWRERPAYRALLAKAHAATMSAIHAKISHRSGEMLDKLFEHAMGAEPTHSLAALRDLQNLLERTAPTDTPNVRDHSDLLQRMREATAGALVETAVH